MAYATSTPERLTDPELASVRALVGRAEARDGQPPLSDQALTRLTSATVRHVLAHDGPDVIGYAQLDGASLELLADRPDALPALLAAAEVGAPAGLQIWAHGQRSPVGPVLAARGYQRTRVLHQLRRPLTERPTPAAVADGVSVRAFRPGADEPAWLRVNAAAFAHHPEQGRWTITDLEAREAEPWFDAAGLLLAVRADQVIGFHWTKVHDDDGAGEVYVLAVDPSAQGLGLGATLLARGLDHLYDRGCRTVLLYVDESNPTALHLYERAGFTRYDADTQWTRGGPTGTSGSPED